MKRLFTSALLALVASCAGQGSFAFAQSPQTWVYVGGYWQSYTLSAPATLRFGYPSPSGGNWITVNEPAGDLPNSGNGSVIPIGVAGLANPSGSGFEVDVLQSGTPVVVEEEDVWNGCETVITYTIPAIGTVATLQTACPGDTTPPPVTTPPVTTPPVTTPPVTTPPVTTPPVTTPPVTTPPVTTPPVTTPPVTTPPVTTPPGSIPISSPAPATAAGTVSVDAAGNITIVFPAGTTLPAGGGIVGNAGGYTIFVFNNLPVLGN